MNPRRPAETTAHPPRRRRPDTRKRIALVFGVLGVAACGLVARAIDLQVVHQKFLQQQGDARFLREVEVPVSRGTIYDRNGVPLAVSTPMLSLWANPKELLQHADRIGELAKALGVNAVDLNRKLEQRNDRDFVYLRRLMPPDAAKAVLALDIPGVNSEREYKRFYPDGAATAHVLGFTNIDDHGQEGLELAYDGWLAGKPGEKRVMRDRLGHTVENVEQIRAPTPGHDLTLSIDSRIQYLAYSALSDAVAKRHAASGSMVILDPRNGEILAMVNVPSYNPNDLDSSDPAQRRNRAVTDVTEPGSTMKPFTVTTALESGEWTPSTMIDTSPGTFTLDGHLIRDDRNNGRIDVSHVITYSSNVGASKISLTLTAQQMAKVLHQFGFGQSTGSGFPGEVSGYIPAPRTWGDFVKATIAFGYGINVTALQLAQAYAAIADGGMRHTPTFIKGADNPGVRVEPVNIASEMMAMLRTVVGAPPATAPQAAIADYTVAGKTGTAHLAVAGGYSSNRYAALFCGIVPASDPRLVGVVIIRDAGGHGGEYFGGLVSAPVFRDVMTGALRLLDVPPDNVQQWYAGGPVTPAPVPKPEVAVAPAKQGATP
ncbi:MAG TPA: penicillin-binding protein 2 [Rhodanobacteraceae bacterium]|jgi:cell division protein FtsI (penicillin-binding protein 3)|nr:penicillin-binding protein 2 [Rhodanobacteraceae bacterium]